MKVLQRRRRKLQIIGCVVTENNESSAKIMPDIKAETRTLTKPKKEAVTGTALARIDR